METEKPLFEFPRVIHSGDGWGPTGLSDIKYFPVEQLAKYPTARLGRVCDFTQTTQDRQRKQDELMKKKNPAIAPQINAAEQEDGYSLVDNRPAVKTYFRGKGRGTPFRPKGGMLKGKGGKGFRQNQLQNYQEGILGQKPKQFYSNTVQQRGKGFQSYGRPNQRGKIPSFRDWSTPTSAEWTLREEIMLTNLAKVQVDPTLVIKEDVCWAGTLGTYNKNLDRVTVKNDKRLERFEDVKFFNVSTSDDPIVQDIMEKDPEIQVAATDQILAVLMAARSSVYSWDILITKVGNKIVFDKRDGSPVDFLTVSETANETPNNDDKESINAPMKLGQEATCINQNFSQMVLDPSIEPEQMEHPNPFDDAEEGSRVALGAYRYRKITLPGNAKDPDEFKSKNVTMLVRTEVHTKIDNNNYCYVRALNEYDPKQGLSWRTHLETQRGAVFAGELKNNAFKLAKWTAEAMLSGCDTMKIGYVSRESVHESWSHRLLNVQTYQTESFSAIGMTESNSYGVIRSIIDLINGLSEGDGRYLLQKDPTKPVLRLHEIPWEFFESDDDKDDDDAIPEEDD
eukprot:GEMP01014744.1.p1 GENE.GEMP01014744.1~~GEMP01014744.1.p1  ORF type:complete len:574 (+),score=124.54 GEMP01014744.1:23-1723(+)